MIPRGMVIASDAPALLLGVMRGGDMVLVAAMGVLGYVLRYENLDMPGHYIVAILVGTILTANVMHIGGAYTPSALRQLAPAIGQLTAGWLSVVLMLIVLGYFTKTSDEFSRTWLSIWGATTVLAMAAARAAVSWQFARWRRSGFLRIRLAVVGARDLAQRLVDHLQARTDEQFDIVGIFDGAVGGTVEDLVARFRQAPLDEIVIALPWRETERIATILKALKALPVNVRLCSETLGFELPTRGLAMLAGVPMLAIFERPLMGWNVVLKAIEDRVLATIALVSFLPLMALIAIVIKLDSKGPVLFGQRRYGFNNNEFFVYKFRTMFWNACDDSGARQARRNDPRVTRVGAFLRRTSLDELPQFFNVLKGDMSLVGPRPHPVAHNVQFAKVIDDYLSRHRVKPGITGWAQVNGLRGEIDTPRKMQLRVQHDLYYIDNWSLLLDFKILLLTLFVGFAHKNAY